MSIDSVRNLIESSKCEESEKIIFPRLTWSTHFNLSSSSSLSVYAWFSTPATVQSSPLPHVSRIPRWKKRTNRIKDQHSKCAFGFRLESDGPTSTLMLPVRHANLGVCTGYAFWGLYVRRVHLSMDHPLQYRLCHRLGFFSRTSPIVPLVWFSLLSRKVCFDWLQTSRCHP